MEAKMYLTAKQAAEKLNMTSRRVLYLISAKNPDRRLMAIRPGNEWLIEESEVERFAQVERSNGRPKCM
jgi:excisionase family DNA binding protein